MRSMATLLSVGDSPSPSGRLAGRRLLLIIGIGLAVTIGVIAGVAVGPGGDDPPEFVGSPPPVQLVAPTYSLQDETGTTVDGDELRGQVIVLTFLSTNCRAQCPPTASTIRVAMEGLSAQEQSGVAVIAISIDPAFDDMQTASMFLEERRLTGVMHYLLGTAEELQPVWSDYGVLSSLDTGSSDNHSVPVRIFDRDGVWVSSLRSGDDLSADNLAHDVREALDS